MDLRFRHGMHALEMHLLFADLDKVDAELEEDLESSCSSLGRIDRMAWYEVERKATALESCRQGGPNVMKVYGKRLEMKAIGDQRI